MDEEDPVCPLPAITEACKPKCTSFLQKYNACVERIEKKGEGDCEGWYFDYLHCVDKCKAPQIMKHLK
eukprot:CAMPEP_0116957626 /NCGR_PEP_ID=MMETSP0467-20121206/44094_1 /TAXON_ID=283647 /ORGANISM="Mesodinium pulex, Strain SPMC105" /LENGTH=67 /DNA_ID=CAMNT_0004644433 /DNA_START=27 /DNA_END=230 /DNA_ORIENTATION=+